MKRIVAGCCAVVFLIGCGSSTSETDGDSTTSTTESSAVTSDTAIVEISLTIGENSGPNEQQQVALGSTVRLSVVNPNASDEIHVHGYDISTGDMAAGETSVIEFIADEAGTFDIESHISEEVVLLLIVE
jgi:FtsP/CotA-like multicopper oxidase with cupredoxin domain